MKKSSTDSLKIYKYLLFFLKISNLFYRLYRDKRDFRGEVVFSTRFVENRSSPPFIQISRPRQKSQVRRGLFSDPSYFLMVIPRMRSTPRKIFAAALSASSTVSVWSALRSDTEKETLFLPSPICAPR